MKKILLLSAALFAMVSLRAQDETEKVKKMLDAENAFARMSKEENTKKAFLEYLSDSSVMFDQSRPVKGMKSWQERKENNSVLFWWPVFAGISTDGKLGFSTGPWEFSASKSDKPSAFGYYATVWEQQPDGKWKMAADIGVSLPKAEDKNPPLTISKAKKNSKEVSAANAHKELLDLAVSYDKLINGSDRSVAPSYFTKDARLLRENEFPYLDVFSYTASKNSKFQFTTSGAGIAVSSDLGYTYGTASSVVTEGGVSKNIHHYFMKVWKKENNQWKIVLDVLGGA